MAGISRHAVFHQRRIALCRPHHHSQPTYAQEIQKPEFGYGLEGLLAYRRDDLSGIINGIDTSVWNPEKDAYINQNYSARTIGETAEQGRPASPVGFAGRSDLPLFALIGRLVEQKGIDLVLSCLPDMTNLPLQFVLLVAAIKA